MNSDKNYIWPHSQHFDVGVDELFFDQCYRQQRNSNWCLPATFESIAKYYGHNILQEQIVAENCGVLTDGTPKNCASKWYIFNNIMNGCRERYCVDLDFHTDFPCEDCLYEELAEQKPIIVDYLPLGAKVGHALIVTGAEGYIVDGKANITKLRLRDPAQFQYGRAKTVNIDFFKSRVRAHWYVSITPERMWADAVWHNSYARVKMTA